MNPEWKTPSALGEHQAWRNHNRRNEDFNLLRVTQSQVCIAQLRVSLSRTHLSTLL